MSGKDQSDTSIRDGYDQARSNSRVESNLGISKEIKL